MIRLLISILCIIYGPINSFGQITNLQGKVKSVEIITRDFKASKMVYKYNEKGFLTELTEPDDDYTYRINQTYTYDEKDRIIEHNANNDPDRPDCIYKTTYEYDIAGNNMETTSYNAKGRIDYKDIYIYNEKVLIEKKIRKTKKESQDFEVYTYDDQGKLIGYSTEESNGLVYRKAYQYDTKGNKLETISYDYFGKVYQTIDFTYDEMNILTSETSYRSPTKILSETIKYDKKGNTIEVVYYGDDRKLHSRNTYLYDGKNNIIEKVLYSSETRIDKKETYTYDEKGNKLGYLSYNNEGEERDEIRINMSMILKVIGQNVLTQDPENLRKELLSIIKIKLC